MLDLEQLYKNKEFILKESLENFINSSSLIPKIGIELEFYLFNRASSSNQNPQAISSSEIDEFIVNLLNNLKEDSSSYSLINVIEKEQGVGQIEIKTLFDADIFKLCQQIEKVKIIAKNLAIKRNLICSFAAQPFLNDCGSSLQFNISLHDKLSEENLFTKNNIIFFNSIAALLNYTDTMLILLAPNPVDYLRFNLELNRNLHKKGKYTAPINLSFGENNRTTAIRIPALDKNKNYGKRIEYRVASASADPYLSISAILSAISLGIKNNLTLEEIGLKEIHGNAFDEQYQLKSFAKSYEEALNNFNYLW